MGVKRFSVSVDNELLKEFDELVKNLSLDRSKAIQQAMRIYLLENIWEKELGECGGAITIIYRHDERNNLIDLQHNYRDIINSTLHIHLDEENCLEIIAVKGDIKKVKELINKIKTCKGVKQIRHAIVEIYV
ncbi:MAG: nickel-responsive transcriptional regulator NikR [Candidatus Verstraetearchaeota archaeon]|nr:nickel-responsive transcriptional regulator NikR [Candidatus Verstraetearchaeota archaeon]